MRAAGLGATLFRGKAADNTGPRRKSATSESQGLRRMSKEKSNRRQSLALLDGVKTAEKKAGPDPVATNRDTSSPSPDYGAQSEDSSPDGEVKTLLIDTTAKHLRALRRMCDDAFIRVSRIHIRRHSGSNLSRGLDSCLAPALSMCSVTGRHRHPPHGRLGPPRFAGKGRGG